MSPVTQAEAERLVFLAEECAEVVQAVTKILRHGWTATDPTVTPPKSYLNRLSLTKELGDLVAAARLMVRAGDLGRDEIEQFAEQKLGAAGRYLHHQPKGILL